LSNRKRLWGYLSLAIISGIAFILQASFKEALDIHITRDRGSLYFYNGDGEISNSYLMKLHNKSNEVQTLDLSLNQAALEISSHGSYKLTLEPMQKISRNIQVHCNNPCNLFGKTDLTFLFTNKNGYIIQSTSRFFSPRN